jgi:CRP/FNR family transcriptional regulator
MAKSRFIVREKMAVNFLMYYLQPGQACAVSMICATKSQTSMMAKVVEDVDLILFRLL